MVAVSLKKKKRKKRARRRAIEKIRVPDIREQPPTESTLSSGDDSDIDADEDTTLADATSTAQSTALLRYNFVSAGISD